MNDLTIGIAGGLITSLIIYLGAVFVNQYAIPEVRRRVYRGINLSGKWMIKHNSNPVDGRIIEISSTTSLELTQKGHNLSGVAATKYNDNSADRIYEITGHIRDRFVLMYFTIQDKESIGYQSYLLEVVATGKVMKGYRAFYGPLEESIRSIACEIQRQQ